MKEACLSFHHWDRFHLHMVPDSPLAPLRGSEKDLTAALQMVKGVKAPRSRSQVIPRRGKPEVTTQQHCSGPGRALPGF